MLALEYNIYKPNIGDSMIRYFVLITVVVFVCIIILILKFYLKNNKSEAEIESERIEEIWELQKKNLEIDLREANDMGAFKSYEYQPLSRQQKLLKHSPINKDDLKILNEYVEKEQPYVFLDLPNIAAAKLDVTPDEIRNRWKEKK